MIPSHTAFARPPTMKSMKGLSSKMLGSIKKRTDSSGDTASATSDSAVDLQGDSPEAVAARSVV